MTSNQPWWLTWPPAEVAATILPLFSSAPSQDELSVIGGIVSWWKTGQYRASFFKSKSRFEDPDFGAAAEALQVLERAGLLMGAVLGANKFVRREIGLTRLGRHALATNTVRQHLGLSDAPPTVSN
jgi:hypothetical protein